MNHEQELRKIIIDEIEKNEITHIITNGAIGTAIQSFFDFEEIDIGDTEVITGEAYTVGMFKNVEVRIDPNIRWDDTKISFLTLLSSEINISKELLDNLTRNLK